MNNKLQRTFDDLERERMRLLDEIRSLPIAVLTAAPMGKWSILRIVSHLISAERMGLDYVRKKILGVKEARNSGLFEDWKLFVFKVSQRLPLLKYKAPRVIEERTVVYVDMVSVDNAWSKVRNDWRAILESVPDEYVDRKIFRHVVGGRFNLSQGLVILSEHLKHHMPQIRDRIRAR